ncbi:hypothetical protein [Aquimarina pacifica]|uniref:hypothetical protein n=1 Tax=Aquimarina pacifica TaxID=1296415 RepID=UPI000471EE65|nr:hypothetical protein [Aquimarina pacifica]
MRYPDQKKKEVRKVKVAPLHAEKKVQEPRPINFVIITVLFLLFLTLSIRASNLFFNEILVCSTIIGLLCIPQLISKSNK